MVSQEAIDLAYGLLDATIEYNAKMSLMYTLLAYCVVLFVFTFWIERKSEDWNEKSNNFRISRVLLKRFYRWVSGAYLFIFPLMFLFAYRGAAFETLLQLIYGLYIPLFGAMALWGIMYLWDIVYEFTGLIKSRNKRRGR